MSETDELEELSAIVRRIERIEITGETGPVSYGIGADALAAVRDYLDSLWNSAVALPDVTSRAGSTRLGVAGDISSALWEDGDPEVLDRHLEAIEHALAQRAARFQVFMAAFRLSASLFQAAANPLLLPGAYFAAQKLLREMKAAAAITGYTPA